jgi:DNA-binding CsgD family transcriptional regulator
MHRGNMMDRLGVATVAQAVAVAIEAGLRAPD